MPLRGSGGRMLFAECGPFCALKACCEGVQIVAIETVSQKTLFPQRVSSTWTT